MYKNFCGRPLLNIYDLNLASSASLLQAEVRGPADHWAERGSHGIGAHGTARAGERQVHLCGAAHLRGKRCCDVLRAHLAAKPRVRDIDVSGSAGRGAERSSDVHLRARITAGSRELEIDVRGSLGSGAERRSNVIGAHLDRNPVYSLRDPQKTGHAPNGIAAAQSEIMIAETGV